MQHYLLQVPREFQSNNNDTLSSWGGYIDKDMLRFS